MRHEKARIVAARRLRVIRGVHLYRSLCNCNARNFGYKPERLDVPVEADPMNRRRCRRMRRKRITTEASSVLILSGPRGAATRLGINRSTLQFRLKKLGIERPV